MSLNWTNEDKEVLINFLRTSTGSKLNAILLGHVAAQNEQAVNIASDGPDKGQYACGRARGYRDAYAWFQSLSAHAGAANNGENEPSDGDSEYLERLSP